MNQENQIQIREDVLVSKTQDGNIIIHEGDNKLEYIALDSEESEKLSEALIE